MAKGKSGCLPKASKACAGRKGASFKKCVKEKARACAAGGGAPKKSASKRTRTSGAARVTCSAECRGCYARRKRARKAKGKR
jgi:hypothetical protein